MLPSSPPYKCPTAVRRHVAATVALVVVLALALAAVGAAASATKPDKTVKCGTYKTNVYYGSAWKGKVLKEVELDSKGCCAECIKLKSCYKYSIDYRFNHGSCPEEPSDADYGCDFGGGFFPTCTLYGKTATRALVDLGSLDDYEFGCEVETCSKDRFKAFSMKRT
jgi:hypothetical protein